MLTNDEWIRRIERKAPRSRAEERQALYAELARFGLEAQQYLLAAVWLSGEVRSDPSLDRTQRGELNSYLRSVIRVRERLAELAAHEVVAAGIDPEAVIFIPPSRLNCEHGRRVKECVALREKLDHLRALTVLAAGCGNGPPSKLLKDVCRRLTALPDEIVALDKSVDPSIARPEDFCLSLPEFEGDPIEDLSYKRGFSGRPNDAVRDNLLRTVGDYLYRKVGKTRTEASEVVQRILTSVFGRTDEGGDITDTIERRWRILREEDEAASA